jgi:hypothetical protein
MAQQESKRVKPTLQALLLADHVYRDKTGKHVIAGTFNRLLFEKEGARPKTVEIDGEEKHIVRGGMQVGSPYVYISLTEVRGTVNCSLRYVNLTQDRALLETKFAITCDDPLKTIELVLPLPMLPQIEGVHALELLCDDEPIGSHRVIVEEAQ